MTDSKEAWNNYYKSRYEDIRAYWKEMGAVNIPPPWDELTEEQRQKVIEEEKRYQKEMDDFGKQLSKEHGNKETETDR